MGRLLDEDAVIKVLELWQKAFRENSHYVSASDLSLVVKDVRELPTAQPEPSIPLSWIEKYIEWLKGFDNEFANLEAAHISVMVKKWRGEQHE